MSSKFITLLLFACLAANASAVDIVIDDHATPRVRYGAKQLTDAVKSANGSSRIVVQKGGTCDPEGFSIDTQPDGSIVINGRDDSGEMYGCMELAARVRESKSLPQKIHFSDSPVFK